MSKVGLVRQRPQGGRAESGRHGALFLANPSGALARLVPADFLTRTLPRHYVTEFAGRTNARRFSTLDHMRLMALGVEGKSLPV